MGVFLFFAEFLGNFKVCFILAFFLISNTWGCNPALADAPIYPRGRWVFSRILLSVIAFDGVIEQNNVFASYYASIPGDHAQNMITDSIHTTYSVSTRKPRALIV